MSEKENYRRPPRGHMRDMMVDKPKSMKNAVGALLRYAKKYTPAFVTVLLLAIVGSVLAILGPNYVKKLSDIILEGVRAPLGVNVTMIFAERMPLLVNEIVSLLIRPEIVISLTP